MSSPAHHFPVRTAVACRRASADARCAAGRGCEGCCERSGSAVLVGGTRRPKLSLSQYKGQVVMINFWATWCGPCRQEMPLLDAMYKKYKKMGFTLIGVNVEPDSN